ncbi:MAG: dTMP kinase [Planctomycetaceae bacterium]|nr:MAG: dTMP kinase [Planctomycetaceae bacterium]
MSELAKKLAGRFIVIDGPDGAGKSTQIRMLIDYLKTHGVELAVTRDPGGTPIGDKIRAILLDNSHGEMAVPCELMLYMASRAQLVHQVIAPALHSGKCVLCDRYVSATIAYQGAGGIAAEPIRRSADIATGGLWPVLTIILDTPTEIGLGRVGHTGGIDRMEAKGLEFHSKVRRIFLDQAPPSRKNSP